ncbi:uncharacterized protein [Argopecten irradians]|uniref:uncharacterized protein isoform X2 n=1 Tax=Argopecten irradians TaxID=31199 RepID=UPI00370FDBD1
MPGNIRMGHGEERRKQSQVRLIIGDLHQSDTFIGISEWAMVRKEENNHKLDRLLEICTNQTLSLVILRCALELKSGEDTSPGIYTTKDDYIRRGNVLNSNKNHQNNIILCKSVHIVKRYIHQLQSTWKHCTLSLRLHRHIQCLMMD